MTALRVGFAQRDITPALGLPLGGYGARAGGAEAVLDPLFCRVAVFDDDTAPIALVVLDLVHVFGSWVSRVRAHAADALGLQPDRVLVAATHTHAGPGVFRSTIVADDRVAAYEQQLIDQVITCLGAAKQAAAPATLRFGAAAAPGIAANRNDPARPVDEIVRVLCAYSSSDRLLGVVGNFACHPTVLSAVNCSYSADLFGAAVDAAARELAAPVMLTNGTAGDVSTRFTRRAQTLAEVGRLGTLLSAAVCTAVRQAAILPQTRLAAATLTVKIAWRTVRQPDAAADQLHAAGAALKALRAEGAEARTIRLAESKVEGAQAELWVSSRGGWEAVFGPRQPIAEAQALRCGDVTMLAAPGELFSSAGRWLRQQLGEQTLVVGYANDYLGYFIPEAEAQSGGYESLVAMIDPACEAALRSALVEAARSARGDGSRADG